MLSLTGVVLMAPTMRPAFDRAAVALAWVRPRTSGTGTTVGAAHPAKVDSGALLRLKVPSPLENATGIVLHVAGPISARSVRPSASKSPLITFASGVAAHWAKDQSDAVEALMTLNVPSPLENATGIEP